MYARPPAVPDAPTPEDRMGPLLDHWTEVLETGTSPLGDRIEAAYRLSKVTSPAMRPRAALALLRQLRQPDAALPALRCSIEDAVMGGFPEYVPAVVHELAVNIVSLVIGEGSLEAVQGWLLVRVVWCGHWSPTHTSLPSPAPHPHIHTQSLAHTHPGPPSWR